VRPPPSPLAVELDFQIGMAAGKAGDRAVPMLYLGLMILYPAQVVPEDSGFSLPSDSH